MRYYVSIANVTDETLQFLGYVLVAEDDNTKLSSHFGDELLVDKEDPFLLVDDVNDVQLIRGAGEIISTPDRD